MGIHLTNLTERKQELVLFFVQDYRRPSHYLLGMDYTWEVLEKENGPISQKSSLGSEREKEDTLGFKLKQLEKWEK